MANIDKDELLRLHSSVSPLLIHVIKYIVKRKSENNYIYLYNISKAINIYSTDIRSTLQFLNGKGLNFTGKHKHRIAIENSLVAFWKEIFLYAYNAQQHDLAQFNLILNSWTMDEILNDSLIKNYLPSKISVLKKHELVFEILYNIFTDFETYKQKRLTLLTENARQILGYLELKNISFQDLISKFENNFLFSQAVLTLHRNILLRFSYNTGQNKDELYLSIIQPSIDAIEIQTTCKSQAPAALKCCGKAINETWKYLSQKNNNKFEHLIKNNIIKRQLILFFKKNNEIANDAMRLLIWWNKIFQFNEVLIDDLSISSKKLYQSNYNIVPLFTTSENLDKILSVSQDFDFIRKSTDKPEKLQLTELGRMVISGIPDQISDVKLIWSRRSDMITVVFNNECAPEVECLITHIAIKKSHNKYTIYKNKLRLMKIAENELILILSAFQKLTLKHIQRLRSWSTETTLPPLRSAVLIPKTHPLISEIFCKANGIKPKWQYEEINEYYVIPDLTITKVERWLCQQLENQRKVK